MKTARQQLGSTKGVQPNSSFLFVTVVRKVTIVENKNNLLMYVPFGVCTVADCICELFGCSMLVAR